MVKFAKLVLWTLVFSVIPALAFAADEGNGSANMSYMGYAIGAGLRINFPFLGQPLPIGLFLGTPIRKEDDDRKRAFLFTIGRPF